MPSALLTLMFMLTTAAPGDARVVEFARGSTSIVHEQGVDHVVVRDAKGNMTSESRCVSGSFEEYYALFTKIRDAVARGDRDEVVILVAYPLRVNGKKPRTFRRPASLSKRYHEVFTPDVQAKIRKAEPAAVFCRDGRAMLGDGVIWATNTGMAVLNP